MGALPAAATWATATQEMAADRLARMGLQDGGGLADLLGNLLGTQTVDEGALAALNAGNAAPAGTLDPAEQPAVQLGAYDIQKVDDCMGLPVPTSSGRITTFTTNTSGRCTLCLRLSSMRVVIVDHEHGCLHAHWLSRMCMYARTFAHEHIIGKPSESEHLIAHKAQLVCK